MASRKLGLVEMLAALREEIAEAQQAASSRKASEGKQPVSSLGETEVEIQFTVEKRVEGGLPKVWFVPVEAAGSYKKETVHKLKVKLIPSPGIAVAGGRR